MTDRLAEIEGRLRRVEEAQRSGGVVYRERNPDGEGAWECSGCGVAWELIEGGPLENDMNFCSRCGRPITAIEPYRYPGEDGEAE